MRATSSKFLLFSVFIVLMAASACVRSSNPNVERGSFFRFQEGFPEVRMSSIGLLSENDVPTINVTTDVVLGSLIYSTKDSIRTANIALEIRILQQEGNYSETIREEFSVESDFNTSYQTQEVFTHQKTIEVEPGSYEVNVTVLDQTSGKATTRQSQAEIPDPQDPQINLTTIRLLGKNNEVSTGDESVDYVPITTYTVSAGLDSLKFMFQITNNDAEDPLVTRSRLLKYEADSTAARPMHFNNYSPSSIQYVGVEMREPEEIDNVTRRLDQPGSVLIEFKYELLDRGVYRFEVQTTDEEGEEIYKARDFSIKSDNYPALQSPRELAEPLIYLMDRDDHEEMMEIQDPDSLKEAIDRFWLSNIGNMNTAKSVISLYYERVELANKQFTTYKEGWKTDPGMIFILFGPPWYVDRYLNTMVWSYSYDRTDPRYNYRFERPQMKNEFYPFDNWLLERNQGYFNVQYRQTQLWLTGGILTTRI